jgi:hypothetical protein
VRKHFFLSNKSVRFRKLYVTLTPRKQTEIVTTVPQILRTRRPPVQHTHTPLFRSGNTSTIKESRSKEQKSFKHDVLFFSLHLTTSATHAPKTLSYRMHVQWRKNFEQVTSPVTFWTCIRQASDTYLTRDSWCPEVYRGVIQFSQTNSDTVHLWGHDILLQIISN